MYIVSMTNPHVYSTEGYAGGQSPAPLEDAAVAVDSDGRGALHNRLVDLT